MPNDSFYVQMGAANDVSFQDDELAGRTAWAGRSARCLHLDSEEDSPGVETGELSDAAQTAQADDPAVCRKLCKLPFTHS